MPSRRSEPRFSILSTHGARSWNCFPSIKGYGPLKPRLVASLCLPLRRARSRWRYDGPAAGAAWRIATALGASHRFFDRRERGGRLGAVGPAGLRHVGAPATALAAECFGGDAHQIDRVVAGGEIAGDADDDAGLAVPGDADDGDHAGAELLLAVIG